MNPTGTKVSSFRAPESARRAARRWSLLGGFLISSLVALAILSPNAEAKPGSGERSTAPGEGSGRVVNGTPAAEGSWPSIALIRTDGSMCGGTLIHPQWVLSAAHCFPGFLDGAEEVYVDEPSLSYTTVALGSTDFNGAPRQAVSGVYPNQAFSDDYDNDIALIRLASPSSQPPQAFAKSGDEALYAADTPGFIAGWGTTCFAVCSPSEELLEATVILRSFELCESIYTSSGVPFSQNMVCAGGGEDTSDACQGDSGGPLTADGPSGRVLVGIVSWGVACAEPDFPGVYTKVANYTSWIGQTTLDRVQAPRKVRVRGRATVKVWNRSSLGLPAPMLVSKTGKFKILRTTCRQQVAFASSCSVVVKDLSRRANQGSLTFKSRVGTRLAQVKLRG